MNKKYTIFFLASLIFTVVIISFVSCKKTLTAPSHIPMAVGPAVTIQDLRNLYAYQNIKFTSNSILHAVVTMDETSGNIYKQVYIRDNSGPVATNGYGALSIHLLLSANGYLSVGDSIAINLNGVTLDMSSGGSLQIDSITATSSIIKLKTGLNPLPLLVTLPQLNTVSTSGQFIYDGHLVQLNNVEFVSQNVGLPFATGQNPPAAPLSVNRYINDCIGNTVVTYNSGYANFAYTAANNITIPNKNGSITAIASLYNTMQLTLRSYAEIFPASPQPPALPASAYCPVVYDTITQNFTCAALANKTAITLAGWANIDISGSLKWQGLQYGNQPFFKYSPSVSNYKTTDAINDIWFVSPPIVDNVYAHGGTNTKTLDFSTAMQYGTNARLLSVLVSRTFDGTNVIPSQWTDISSLFPAIPSSAGQSTNGIPLFHYAHGFTNIYNPAPVPITIQGSSPTFYIAFRYRSNTNALYPDSTGSTYLLGSFVLRNN